MELKLENVFPCIAAPFHAKPEDGIQIWTLQNHTVNQSGM